MTDVFEWRPEVGLEGALSLRFLQEPALSLSKERVAMLPRNFCPSCTNPVAYAFVVPTLRQEREGRGTPLCW